MRNRAYSGGRIAAIMLLTLLAGTAQLSADTIDDFESLADWEVIPADGVVASIHSADGIEGKALRLDFEFKSGAGFVVVRRKLDLALAENYRFTFQLRGDAPNNNLEFKLVDPSGENVWWVNKRAYEFPKDWKKISYRARHFSFAWGPSGGKPLERLGAIEFAIASATGGKGSIYLDQLTFEALPPQPKEWPSPDVSFSSNADPSALAVIAKLDPSMPLNWMAKDDDPSPTLNVELHTLRQVGGLRIDWPEGARAAPLTVEFSDDGEHWNQAQRFDRLSGLRTYVPMPDAEGSKLRIRFARSARGDRVGVKHVTLYGPEFGESPNAMFKQIASESARDEYPAYFLGEHVPWTIVGAQSDEQEWLMDARGAIELRRGGPRIEPILLSSHGKTSGFRENRQLNLLDGHLPLPTFRASTSGVELVVTPLARRSEDASRLLIRYQIRNGTEQKLIGKLHLFVRPFQVLPPHHELNIRGGAAHVPDVSWIPAVPRISIAGMSVTSWTIGTLMTGRQFGDESLEWTLTPDSTDVKRVTDPLALAEACVMYDVVLDPNGSTTLVLQFGPTDDPDDSIPALYDDECAVEFEKLLDKARADWRSTVCRTELRLPPSARHLTDTFYAQQAYILINMDGPRIQPGSRTYERSWIRDGALTSTALLYTGHAEEVKKFIDWFTPYQFENGKVPCVVDSRGPDPVPEHDSTGQLIYLLWKYYKFTGDRDVIDKYLPNVIKGVDYLESLRALRKTDEYKNGPPEQRAKYGLVTESISHEGYSAKPMHSYWDDFFVWRGYKDAFHIAQALGREDLMQRFGGLRDEFKTDLMNSLMLAMKTKGIDYLPGCVELGDFDATSTAIALFPTNALGELPEPQTHNTFDRYWKFFCDRRDDKIKWDAYTPYEVRLIGSFVRLGQPERAHALCDWFLSQQTPVEWRQWPEVRYRDPKFPGFCGDLPHTWVGSDFLSAVRSMFVYERESDQSLVLAAAIKPEWLTEGGAEIGDWPTEYGKLSYKIVESSPGRIEMTISGDVRMPPGGVIVRVPGVRRINAATMDGRAIAKIVGREISLPSAIGRLVIETAE